MSENHQNPIVTVDIVLATLRDGELAVLLQKRSTDPFKGLWGLPGGFVHTQEDSDLEAAARRTLLLKTGFEPAAGALEQLAVFSGPSRDPRGWSASLAHVALVPFVEPAAAAHGQTLPVWTPVSAMPAKTAFDHGAIIDAAVSRIRAKAGYSMIAAHLLPAEFTLGELQRAHENILGEALDKSAFRKRIEESGCLVEAQGRVRSGPNRPAKLYSVKSETGHFFKRSL